MNSLFEEVQSKKDIFSKLTYMYENLNEDNMQECCDVFKTLEFQNLVSYAKRKKVEGSTFSQQDYMNIALFVDTLQAIYNYSGCDTGVSDSDYDVLYEILEDQNLDFVSTAIRSSREIGHHKYKRLRGTLRKIYVLDDEKKVNKSRKSLKQWVSHKEKFLKDQGKTIDLMNQDVFIFPKWNGISVIHEFDENNNLVRSLTRGFTELNEAEIVTDVFQPIVNRVRLDLNRNPEVRGVAYGLKTEVIIRDEDFEEYNKKTGAGFKSARSLCNSIILGGADGRESILEIKKLRYSIIRDDEESLERNCTEVFDSPYSVTALKFTKEISKFAKHQKKTEGCDCDGVVIQFIDEAIKEALGRDNDINRFEVAYKFNEEIMYTKMLKVQFQMGPLGRLTPVAIFEPVKMKGNTICAASLGSYQRFLDLGLHKGDTVKILYEIIPYLTFDEDDPKCKRSNGPLFTAPKSCPECGQPFDLTDSSPRCINPDCPSSQKGKILNYVRKMKIDGIDYGTIDILFDCGLLKTIKDLYLLEKYEQEILSIPSFGQRKFDSMINEINFHKEVRGSQLLGSLGISGASKLVFKTVLSVYTMDEVIEFAEENNLEPFMCIKGIKDRKAIAIVNGLNNNRSLIKFLKKELKIIPEDSGSVRFIACFHKIRSKEVAKMIEKKGGRVAENFTKQVDFLIIPDGDIESGKIEKAKKYGIDIVHISDVEEYLNRNYR